MSKKITKQTQEEVTVNGRKAVMTKTVYEDGTKGISLDADKEAPATAKTSSKSRPPKEEESKPKAKATTAKPTAEKPASKPRATTDNYYPQNALAGEFTVYDYRCNVSDIGGAEGSATLKCGGSFRLPSPEGTPGRDDGLAARYPEIFAVDGILPSFAYRRGSGHFQIGDITEHEYIDVSGKVLSRATLIALDDGGFKDNKKKIVDLAGRDLYRIVTNGQGDFIPKIQDDKTTNKIVTPEGETPVAMRVVVRKTGHIDYANATEEQRAAVVRASLALTSGLMTYNEANKYVIDNGIEGGMFKKEFLKENGDKKPPFNETGAREVYSRYTTNECHAEYCGVLEHGLKRIGEMSPALYARVTGQEVSEPELYQERIAYLASVGGNDGNNMAASAKAPLPSAAAIETQNYTVRALVPPDAVEANGGPKDSKQPFYKEIQVVKDGKLVALDNRDTALYILHLNDKAKTARAKLDQDAKDLGIPADVLAKTKVGVSLDTSHFTAVKFQGAELSTRVDEAVYAAYTNDQATDQFTEAGIRTHMIQEDPRIVAMLEKTAKTGIRPSYYDYGIGLRANVGDANSGLYSEGHHVTVATHFDHLGKKTNVKGMQVLVNKDNPVSMHFGRYTIAEASLRGAISEVWTASGARAPGVNHLNKTGLQIEMDSPVMLTEAGRATNGVDGPLMEYAANAARQSSAMVAGVIKGNLALDHALYNSPSVLQASAELGFTGMQVEPEQLIAKYDSSTMPIIPSPIPPEPTEPTVPSSEPEMLLASLTMPNTYNKEFDIPDLTALPPAQLSPFGTGHNIDPRVAYRDVYNPVPQAMPRPEVIPTTIDRPPTPLVADVSSEPRPIGPLPPLPKYNGTVTPLVAGTDKILLPGEEAGVKAPVTTTIDPEQPPAPLVADTGPMFKIKAETLAATLPTYEKPIEITRPAEISDSMKNALLAVEKHVNRGKVIDRGDRGAPVENLQTFFISAGMLNIKKPTGNFRNLTEHTVEDFQGDVGIQRDGKVYKETAFAMRRFVENNGDLEKTRMDVAEYRKSEGIGQEPEALIAQKGEPKKDQPKKDDQLAISLRDTDHTEADRDFTKPTTGQQATTAAQKKQIT